MDEERTNRQGRQERQEAEPDAELDGLAHRVIGSAIEVHKILGPGYLESVYEEALAVELTSQQIPFARQVAFGVDYKGTIVGHGRIDILVANRLIVELKAVECFAPIHVAQVLSYLKASKLRLGLLVTFNVRVLRDGIRRVILPQPR